MNNPHAYAAANTSQFLDQLLDLLRIPSVSTDPERAADVHKAADWLAADMKRIGLHNVEVLPTAGHPVVYGEWLDAGAKAPTLLVYGHYDVQPAVLSDGWDHEPFDPVIHDGKIYARGATDDKGQMFAQLKATESLLANGGKSPVNLKFLIEGEEEIGTPNLAPFIVANRDKLKADACLICDTGMAAPDQPSLCYTLRGLMYLELEIQGPKQDLHSGGFGGMVHNPAQALAEIIAQLHNPDGSINVPGFYDDVVLLSPDERDELARSAQPDSSWKEATGVPQFWGEADYALHERVGARPTLEINGFVSGFYGAGTKTVLPAKALAKISCRLVANQNPHRIYELVSQQIARLTPPTVRSTTRLLASASPASVDLSAPAIQAAVRAYGHNWSKKPIFERGGGTLPIVADLQRELGGLPVVMMGFGLDDCNAHGPNETFPVAIFDKAVDTIIYFIEELTH
jgi:acetylornithine deacetylase/succinyl-diaminopimelate desuccinylase-like protein